MLRSKKILITSNSSSFDLVKEWCLNHDIHLIQSPQIETKALNDLSIPSTDWIFFSSPRSVKMFLQKNPITAKKIAVYGNGTLAICQEMNLNVDYCGATGLPPSEIGRDFSSKITPFEKVLFPLSNRSKRSISEHIKPKNRIELVVYETELKPHHYEATFDAILFTSPSNYMSFLQKNEIHKNTWVVAIGETTAQAIGENYANFYCLSEPNAIAFIGFLERFID